MKKSILLFVVLLIAMFTASVFGATSYSEDELLAAGFTINVKPNGEKWFSGFYANPEGRFVPMDPNLEVIVLHIGESKSFVFDNSNSDDAVFTCDSDPADFHGKSFNNLYVLIDGCKNLESTAIPGEDSFVTLKDITVDGCLYYWDDSYQTSTSEIVEPNLRDSSKHADTYLNIIGNSYIWKAQAQCAYKHNCNFGIQYPTWVEYMEVMPMNKTVNGKIVLRGKIDPFIDEGTDYYHDTTIKAFPNFNLATFDLDLVNVATVDYDNFSFADLTTTINETNYIYPYSLRGTLKRAEYGKEITELFRRGYIIHVYPCNSFALPLGETEIDLANIAIGEFTEWNWAYKNDEKIDVRDLWTLKVVSRGFTTIGMMGMDSSFKTGIYVPAPYNTALYDLEKQPLPLYVDLMVLGGVGKKLQYDMDNTKITMLNYVGNENSGSKLDLNMGNVGVTWINSPSIGIANIIGGKFDMSCKQSVRDNPSIDILNFYEGLESYKIDETVYDTLEKMYFGEREYTNTYLFNINTETGEDDIETKPIREKRNNLYNKKIVRNTMNWARSVDGYFFITATLDGMIEPGKTDMKGQSVIGFYGQNISLGDINVSKNLDPIVNWMDGSCHFWQHGKTQMIVGKIN